MSTQEFKVGDRVRAKRGGVGFVSGQEFTVQGLRSVGRAPGRPDDFYLFFGVDPDGFRADDFEHAEPEDTDDAYVEPEPLKAGDWVWVAGQITETHHHPEDVTVEMFSHNEQYQADVRRDRIKPMEGVPEWVKPAQSEATLKDAAIAVEVFSHSMRALGKQVEAAAKEFGQAILRGPKDGAS